MKIFVTDVGLGQKENIANYSCLQYNHYISIMRGIRVVKMRMRGIFNSSLE